MFLNGNFVALSAFKKRYGVYVEGSGYTIPTKWQSALFQSGQCGAFVGVFMAGPITNRLGYRWTTLLALVLMNATIFISFFVGNLGPIFSLQADILRPTRLLSWLSGKPLKVFPGDCSLRTLPLTPVRLFLSSSVVPARLLCNCLGLSVILLCPALPYPTTIAMTSGLGERRLPCSGSFL